MSHHAWMLGSVLLRSPEALSSSLSSGSVLQSFPWH